MKIRSRWIKNQRNSGFFFSCYCFVDSNIDTRIQQAELQYKLGREELELLTLGEQARALAQLIEQADARARAATLQRTLYR